MKEAGPGAHPRAGKVRGGDACGRPLAFHVHYTRTARSGFRIDLARPPGPGL
jgi:hypothetical protein